MNANAIVLYDTRYGNTQRYALWIAEALGCEAKQADAVNWESLGNYSLVVYGGGIYAGGVRGIQRVKNHWESLRNKLIVFTVGIGDPVALERQKVIPDRVFTPEMRQDIRVFHFRGRVELAKLGLLHRLIIKMLQRAVRRKSLEERTPADEQLLEAPGGVIDYTNQASIVPLVEWARTKMQAPR